MESVWALKSDKQELELASLSLRFLVCKTPDHTGLLQGLNKIMWAKFLVHCRCVVNKERKKIRRNMIWRAWESFLEFTTLGFRHSSTFFSICFLQFCVFLSNLAPQPSTPFCFIFSHIHDHPLALWCPRESLAGRFGQVWPPPISHVAVPTLCTLECDLI